MAKVPISEFYNLMAVTDAVIHVSVNGGPAFVARPGSEKDQSTPAESRLWKYMRAEYLFDLLEKRSLFFTRLTHYHTTDPFEGALPYAVSKLHEQIVRSKGGDVDEFKAAREHFIKKWLKVVLVNCWHEREYESRSMWDRYGKGEAAVALVSTFQRLKDSVPSRVDVGHVDYIDIGCDEIINHFSNPSQRAFQKLREFEDEHEVRAMIFDKPNRGPKLDEEISIEPGSETGYLVPIDVDNLLEAIVVSPDTPRIIDDVHARVSAATLNIKVLPSSLSRRPTF